ncbi:MAG: DUF3696 domain-containing protein [Candidatus Eremiobacteraeota bacterium]|nr:DUF3696 domain-containing protein [Candidatus Eremiobacteraeota bacterium]
MLRTLRILNFKGWQDTGALELAPLTLLFGVNSSGKSSIGQFLMMLKQTAESADRKMVLSPGDRKSAVQPGTFQQMVYRRDPSQRISFEYLWDLPEGLAIKDSFSGKQHHGDRLSFEASVGINEQKHSSIFVERFHYNLQRDDGSKVLAIGMERLPYSDDGYEVKASEYILQPKEGRSGKMGPPVRFYGFPDEVAASFLNAEFVQELNLLQEKLFRSIFYLGPLRTRAERLYTWAGNEPEGVGFNGEHTVSAILSAKNRWIGIGKNGPEKAFEQVIAEKLKDMGLIKSFKVSSISKKRQEYEVKISTGGAGDTVELPDVGFGISQVLPVLVQCFYAPRGSIIIMEQPELHLHPSAQSALADVMIEVISSREDKVERNIQLVMETHSEHFLRRLQRRVAEGTVESGKVRAYFADVSGAPPHLDPLRIDEFGTILNWPEHFFGDEMGDVAEQARAANPRSDRQQVVGMERCALLGGNHGEIPLP